MEDSQEIDMSSFFPELQNNPPVNNEYFFQQPPPAPTQVEQTQNADQTVFLLIKILGEMNTTHTEDRRKIDSLEQKIESINRKLEYLVGRKEDKLERCSEYRRTKKQKTNPFSSIEKFCSSKSKQ
jgi:hypothetical protein